jgi:hypothetical protein
MNDWGGARHQAPPIQRRSVGKRQCLPDRISELLHWRTGDDSTSASTAFDIIRWTRWSARSGAEFAETAAAAIIRLASGFVTADRSNGCAEARISEAADPIGAESEIAGVAAMASGLATAGAAGGSAEARISAAADPIGAEDETAGVAAIIRYCSGLANADDVTGAALSRRA